VTLILGINAFHPDAAACLVCDGKLVAAVAEERLGSRIKHVAGFPRAAVRCVLDIAGTKLPEVDYVAIGHDSNANLRAKARFVCRYPISTLGDVVSHLPRRVRISRLEDELARACDVSVADCRFKVIAVEHHLAHIASAFFASPFERAAGFSYDGSGDFVTAMYAACEGNTIRVLRRVWFPDSLGFFYTAICQFIGFDRFGDEYKVMGLAAYGQPTYVQLMRDLLRCDQQGGFRLDRRYFSRTGARGFAASGAEYREIVLQPLYTPRFAELFGAPRQRNTEITARDKDLACSCQQRFEEAVLQCLDWLHRQVGGDTLVTAGGCALNGVCNARILRDTPFTRSYIQCAASDDGTAIGAALYVWNSVLGKPRSEPIEHAYWGPEHPESRMEAALKAQRLEYRKFDRLALLEEVSEHLCRGHVVGWYQGRSEWGPRALGNRSILAHPGWPGMKDLINHKIKRREPFRPFAPTILAEAVSDYFEQAVESPFMMHLVKIRPERRAALAAVCHQDATGRLHTVKRSQNPLYYDLIAAFARKTGIPVLLNTSFNENEPIVDTPEQAVDCFVRNDLDVLVLGPFVTAKPGKQLSESEQSRSAEPIGCKAGV